MSYADVFDPRIELMPREELLSLQAERLKRQLSYVYGCSSFYRKKFDEAGVRPDEIKGKEDLDKIPPTTAKEIFMEMQRLNDHRAGLLCVPDEQVHVETGPQDCYGSMAKQYPDYPVFALRTLTDIDMMNTLIARCWYMMGVRGGQLVLVSPLIWEVFAHSMMPQLCWPLSAAGGKIGVTTVALDSFVDSDLGNVLIETLTKPRAGTVLGLRPAAIFMNAFGLRKIIEWNTHLTPFAEKINTRIVGVQEFKNIPSAAERKELSKDIGFEPNSILKIQDPGFFASDCPERKGLHVYEDYFLVEAVDEKGKSKPAGEVGKLAITNLYAQAMPLIRYLTDIDVMIDEEVCTCGRTHLRIITPSYK